MWKSTIKSQYLKWNLKNFKIKSLEKRKDEFTNIELSFDKLKDIAIFKFNNKICKVVKILIIFIINEKSILRIFSNENKQLRKSLKYYLKNLEFSREKGNKIEKYLKYRIIEDIISFYYKNIPSNIFKDKNVIKLFKDNSFYFL